MYSIISPTSLIALACLGIIFLTSILLQKRKHSDSFYTVFHFLGGFFVAMASFGLTHSVWSSLLLTLVIGVAWEVYEYIVGTTSLGRYVFQRAFKITPGVPKMGDTCMDICVDILGAFVFIIFFV